jgi:hypothetical protein
MVMIVAAPRASAVGEGKRFRLQMTSDDYELSPVFMQLR